MCYGWNNGKVGVVESLSMHRIVDGILSSTSLCETLAGVAGKPSELCESAFEVYAGALLRDAGAVQLAELPAAKAIKILAPEDGYLARLVGPSKLPHAARSLAEAAEIAVNRLVGIVDAIDDGLMDGEAVEPKKTGFTLYGGAYRPGRASYRSALVRIPRVPASERRTVGYYNEVDWRVSESIANIAHTVFQRCLKPNIYQSVLGAAAPNRSDWDVRTRLAATLQALELPFRCRYRFDCDIDLQTVSIRFTCPSMLVLPGAICDRGPNGVSVRAIGEGARLQAYRVHLIRFACLLAAACFGAGRDVERVVLSGMDERWDHARFSCSFRREGYVRSVISAIDTGSFADRDLRFEPEKLAASLEAEHIDWAGRGGAPSSRIPMLDDGMSAHRVSPWLDGRPLGPNLEELFHAKMICDIDTLHYHGGRSELLDEAKRDAEESVMAATLRLELLVEELDAESRPHDGEGPSRPLYCPHPMARLAVALLGDELSVSSQAEAFLRNDDAESALEGEPPLYARAPNALYHAHIGLSDLYQRMGDYQGAEMHVNRCLDLAPTAVDGYFRKADILAEQGQPAQAANVLAAGLAYATTHSDAALLYYYLGLVLWNMGKKSEAAAIHVYNASLGGEFGDKSLRIVAGMRRRDDAPVIVHASSIAARQEMARLRIPVAPVDMGAYIARAALGLACANAPAAAAPYAEALARICGSNRVIVAACRSLQFGTL